MDLPGYDRWKLASPPDDETARTCECGEELRDDAGPYCEGCESLHGFVAAHGARALGDGYAPERLGSASFREDVARVFLDELLGYAAEQYDDEPSSHRGASLYRAFVSLAAGDHVALARQVLDAWLARHASEVMP